MSYRRSLSGVNSQPPGRTVFNRALSGFETPPGIVMGKARVPIYSRGQVPSWYRAMQGVSGTSLGDDTLDATTQWQKDMLASNRQILEAHKTWADGDRFQKWIAIGATLAIPLSAAIWRALGVGRKKKKSV